MRRPWRRGGGDGLWRDWRFCTRIGIWFKVAGIEVVRVQISEILK